MAICKICGKTALGETIFDKIVNNKLSIMQRFQLKGVMVIAKGGLKVIGEDLDTDDPKERVKSVLTMHFTQAKNVPHAKALMFAVKSKDDMAFLEKYTQMTKKLINFLY